MTQKQQVKHQMACDMYTFGLEERDCTFVTNIMDISILGSASELAFKCKSQEPISL